MPRFARKQVACEADAQSGKTGSFDLGRSSLEGTLPDEGTLNSRMQVPREGTFDRKTNSYRYRLLQTRPTMTIWNITRPAKGRLSRPFRDDQADSRSYQSSMISVIRFMADGV
jgi:hypothetical protein